MPEGTAYAVPSPTAPFEKTTITRREPGPTEIFIDIAYAGICHSDIHTARGEWGRINYPFVGGHEIAVMVGAMLVATSKRSLIIVDGIAACAALRAWDNHGDVTSRGSHVWDEFWRRVQLPAAQLYDVPFDAADPLNTPRDLKASAADALRQAFAAAGALNSLEFRDPRASVLPLKPLLLLPLLLKPNQPKALLLLLLKRRPSSTWC